MLTNNVGFLSDANKQKYWQSMLDQCWYDIWNQQKGANIGLTFPMCWIPTYCFPTIVRHRLNIYFPIIGSQHWTNIWPILTTNVGFWLDANYRKYWLPVLIKCWLDIGNQQKFIVGSKLAANIGSILAKCWVPTYWLPTLFNIGKIFLCQ